MPIRIEHQPHASVIAGAAFAGGQFDRERVAAQLQLAYDQMAQQAANQQRQIAAQQQSQMFNRAAQERMAMFDAARQMNLLGAQQQFQMGNAQMQRGWDVADQQADFAAAENRLGMQLGAAQDARQWNWDVGAVENFDDQFAAIDKAAGQIKFNPQGQTEYADWLGKRQAVEKQRASLRPAQYAELQGKRLAESPLGRTTATAVVERWILDDIKDGRAESAKIGRFRNEMGWLRRVGEQVAR
jgi:hypothetical protein